MLSLFCFLTSLSHRTGESVTLEPTDDAWVYQFAEDQVSDQFLRVWGSDAGAIGVSFDGHLPFSYSCLKFDLSKLDSKGQLKSAKLVLTHVPEAGWDGKEAKSHPVEARSLPTDWNEKSWVYEDAKKIHPSTDPAFIFGTGVSTPPENDKPFLIEIDLMEKSGVFAQTLKALMGMPDKSLGIALTSTLQPGQSGDNTVYKFYSKANDPDLRPKLVLSFDSGH